MSYGRELLKDVDGYVPGEQPQGARLIKLNTNENPYPPSPRVLEALRAVDPERLRKYPDPLASRFRQICAARYGYPDESWVIAGNGMDELLAMALRTFVDPGDTVVSPYPTYSLYEVLAQLHGARFMSVKLDAGYQLPEAFFSIEARLCFLPRPNAPTGVCAPRADLARLCQSFPGLVVIDEAYVDFADDHCLDFPKRFENAIVMRTFSKSFSLASMRLGVAVAQPAIIREFLKTKDSYNLNLYTQTAGIAAMEDYAHMEANVARIRATRSRLTQGLRALGFEVPESQSNFVLARGKGAPDAAALFERLRDQGIIVRYFNAPGLDDCLRITVGTDQETELLLDGLARMA
jgi:histidinol-phosphate aminotransferase